MLNAEGIRSDEFFRGGFMKNIIIRGIAMLCLIFFLVVPVRAEESINRKASEPQIENEINSNEKQDSKEVTETQIEEEEVPLGLKNLEEFKRYKRDAIIIIFFGSMIVTTTIGATIKERKERKRLN